MSKLDIQHESDRTKGAFFIEEDDKRIAEMVYVLEAPKKMVIDHTEVDESLEGQGIGTKLLEKLVEYVRKENIKVIPVCPFAEAIFMKREDLQDVLS